MANFVKNMLSSPKARADSTSSAHMISMSPLASPREIDKVFENGTEIEALQTLSSSPLVLKDITLPHSANALHLASRRGWAKVCKELLMSHGCHVTDKDERGWVPLHYAVLYHHLNVVQLLVETYNADLLQSNISGDTPLHFACHHGYKVMIDYFNNNEKFDLTCQNANGDTPFHLACSMFLYMTRYLVGTGKIDFSKQVFANNSPVRAACLQGRWETAIYLVTEHGCNPMGADHYGNTLLHECSRHGLIDTFKIVATSGKIDLSQINKDKDTPLHIACRHAQSSIVDYLVSQNEVDLNCTNEQGHTPVEVACRHSNWQIGLKLILEKECHPAGIDIEGNTFLHGACMVNDYEAVKHIVTMEVVSHTVRNNKGDTPLHISCYNGNMNIVEYLVSLENSLPMSRNQDGNTPLHFASMAGHSDVIQFLITKSNADQKTLNHSANTPLHLVCEFGHTEAAKTLVSAAENSGDLKSLLTLSNGQGKTPTEVALICQKWGTAVYMATLAKKYIPQVERHMHLFCAEGYYELIKEVVSTLQVDVNCRDRFKNTPLHHACKSGSIDIIQYLLKEAQADPSCLNELLNAPIHTASLEGHLEAVRYLMSMRNVDPNCSNKELSTPLHMACSRRHYDVIKFLLKSGRVDPFKSNKEGKTPLDILKSNSSDCNDIISLLQSLKNDMIRYPVETYSKVIICGNTMSGKSSLSKVLSDRAGNRRRFSSLGAIGKKFVAGVVSETMGIVPHDVKTPENDNMMIYDLSGHPRYHGSHVAYLRDLNRTSPSVFLLMVDIKLNDKEVVRQLTYWYSLILNTCSPATTPSKVLVIGSHVDGLEKKDLARIKVLLDETMSNIIGSNEELCQYVGSHFLNCSKLYSKRLLPFFNMLTEACSGLKLSLPGGPSLSPYCHALYSFLINKIKDKAITLVNLIYKISSDEACLLPTQTHVLEQLLTNLRDHGLINLLKPNVSSHMKWIIIDSRCVCNEVVGQLFAPLRYSTHLKFNLIENGIVPVSLLEESFSQIPIHILVGILQSLDLCYEVNVKALTQIPNNINTEENPDRKRKLFFPNFVLLIQPTRPKKFEGIGWVCFNSNSPLPFVHLHLAHVLILRLLCTFCLPDVAADSSSSSVATETGSTSIFKHVSSFQVWEAGLSWVTNKGIEVVVKLETQRVTVIVSFTPETSLEHLKLRSSLFGLILGLLYQFLPMTDIQEFLVPRSQIYQLNQQEFSSLEFYNLNDIVSALVSGESTISLCEDTSVKLTELLCDDPYLRLSSNHYQALHDPSLSSEILTKELKDELETSCNDVLSELQVSSSSSSSNSENDSNSISKDGQYTYEMIREHFSYYTILERSGIMATQNEDNSESDCCILYNDSDILALVQKLKTIKNWPLLGKLLQLSDELVHDLVSANPSQEKAIRTLMTVWLESGSGRTVASREMLKIALVEMKEEEVARLL